MLRLLVAMAVVCCGGGFVHASGWEWQELPEAVAKGGKSASVELPAGCQEFILEGNLGFGGNHMGGGLDRQRWTIDLLDKDNRPLRRITAVYGTRALYDGFSDSRYLEMSLDSVSADGALVCLDRNELHNERELYGRNNTLTIDNAGGKLRIWLGKEGGVYVLGGAGMDGVSALRFGGTKSMSLKDTAIKWRRDPASRLRTAWKPEELEMLCAEEPTAGLAGTWRFLDRDTDVRWASPGGRYTLAVVPHDGDKVPDTAPANGDAPAFDIIYLAGAETNGSRWSSGMIKGYLYATPFSNHYDVVWYDSFFEEIGDEVTADLADGAILTFSFPLYKAVLRFVKNN